jgi:hypothetical protein
MGKMVYPHHSRLCYRANSSDPIREPRFVGGAVVCSTFLDGDTTRLHQRIWSNEQY